MRYLHILASSLLMVMFLYQIMGHVIIPGHDPSFYPVEIPLEETEDNREKEREIEENEPEEFTHLLFNSGRLDREMVLSRMLQKVGPLLPGWLENHTPPPEI